MTGWLSGLTTEQRARRTALRAARRLLARRRGVAPEPADVLALADFILTGRNPT